MNHKTLLRTNAVINLLFAIPMLFAPQLIAEMYSHGDALKNIGVFAMARHYGGLLFALGIGFWWLSSQPYSKAIAAILKSNALACFGLTITHILAIYQGVDNSQAWGIIVLSMVLVIWNIIVILKSKEAIK